MSTGWVGACLGKADDVPGGACADGRECACALSRQAACGLPTERRMRRSAELASSSSGLLTNTSTPLAARHRARQQRVGRGLDAERAMRARKRICKRRLSGRSVEVIHAGMFLLLYHVIWLGSLPASSTPTAGTPTAATPLSRPVWNAALAVLCSGVMPVGSARTTMRPSRRPSCPSNALSKPPRTRLSSSRSTACPPLTSCRPASSPNRSTSAIEPASAA